MTQATGGIRWGRAFLAAIIVEIVLTVIAAPVALISAAPAAALSLLVPPASFLITLLVVVWLFCNSERPIANGLVTGLISLAIYVVLAFAASQVDPEQANLSQALGLPYLASHLLKIAGGVAGGWWVGWQRAGAADSDSA